MKKNIFSALASAVLVLGLTSGCQTAAPDISPDRAEQLQSRVLAVTASVADGGLAAALEQLTTLEAELDAAAAEGSVSFARHQRIEAAITALRADIQAAIDALVKPEPEPAPVEPVAPVDDGVDEPAPAPEPDTETDEEKKAREAAEKAAEEAKKKADEEAKKKADEAAKEAEEAAKKAEEERKKAEEEAQKSLEGDGGGGDDD